MRQLNPWEKETARYDLVTDLAKKVGDLKGYDYGYSLPKTGMMIIQHRGVNFLATFTPLSSTEDTSIATELRRQEYKFKAMEAQIMEEKRKENVENGSRE